MPETSLPANNIKHRGLFDFNLLLKEIFDWCNSYRYNFNEKKHKHKPKEREVELFMDKKVNEYVKYIIEVAIRVWDLKTVEVVKDGKTHKVNQGRIEVVVSGTLITDYSKSFGGSKFLQGLQKFMHNYVLKRTIEEEWESGLVFEVNKLIHRVHEALGMEKGVLRVE